MARPKKQPAPEKEQASALNTQEVKEETAAEKRARRILQAGAATKKKLKEIPEPQEAIEAQEATKAAKIIDKIKLVSFSIDFMKDPSDALLSTKFLYKGRDITGLVYRKWHDEQYNQLIQQVSEEIGADPEKLKEKESRTPEQQKALEEASAKRVIDRFDRFFESTYYKAFESLQKEFYNQKYSDDTEGFTATMQKIEQDILEPKEEDTELQNQALLYFFATHEKVKPTGSEPLTEKEHTDLIDILYKLFGFYKNTGKKINFESFFDFIKQDAQPKPKKKLIAESEGVTTTIGDRLFVVTDPAFQDAFITKEKGESGLYAKVKVQENGKEVVKKKLALDINPSFIMAIAKAVFAEIAATQTGADDTKEIIQSKIYIPAFFNELGLSVNDKSKEEGASALSRADNRESLINSIILSLDNIWGVLPNDSEEYKLFSVYSYNPETETVTLVSPYLYSLILALMGKEKLKTDSGAHYHYWQCDLLHAKAANERNQAAVEMATRLLVGLQQRGTTTPDAELNRNKGKPFKDKAIFTFSMTCKGLVQDCPQIREKLKKQPTSTKTQTLKRTFAAMYKILKTKTDLFSYYADAAITEVIPTTKSLDAEIIITHKGANPNYKKPFLQISTKKAQEKPETEETTEE